MTNTAITTVYKHPHGDTFYITIAAKMATDSTFPFKGGDRVVVSIEGKKLMVVKA